MDTWKNFEYKSSVPFIRWGYPEDKKTDLNSLLKKRSILPELFLGLILFASFNSWAETSQSFGNLIIYLLWALIAFGLFTLAIANGKTLLLPDAITRPLTILIILFQLFMAIQTDNAGLLGSAILGGLIVGGIPYLIFQISNGKWIGGGDVKLGFAAGLLLGWKVGLLCLGIMIVLTLLTIGVEVISSKASKTKSPFRVGTGVMWVLSIFIALFVGQSLFS